MSSTLAAPERFLMGADCPLDAQDARAIDESERRAPSDALADLDDFRSDAGLVTTEVEPWSYV